MLLAGCVLAAWRFRAWVVAWRAGSGLSIGNVLKKSLKDLGMNLNVGNKKNKNMVALIEKNIKVYAVFSLL